MPFVRCVLKPGIVTESTQYAAEGNYIDANLVRFRFAQPQQVGGWTPFSSIAAPLDGICRAIHTWVDLSGVPWMALGTERRLYLENVGQFYDITPVFSTGVLTNPFSTLLNSAVVSVTFTNHGFNSTDLITFVNSTQVGGLTVSGQYVLTVIDVNTFTVTASSLATSTTTNIGGNVSYQYFLPVGSAVNSSGLGFGVGAFSDATYGTLRSGIPGAPVHIAMWTLDHAGQDLIANRWGWPIFQWVKTDGPSTPAVMISEAPQICNTILVTQDRFLIAFGCSDPGSTANFDPLSIKWSTQGDFTNWTPSLTASAGFYRINTANEIRAAKYISENILIFTDLDLYLMQPLPSAQLVFGFHLLGVNCGPISKNAVCVQNNVAYWMGEQQFYMFSSGVQPITPCTVLRHVFGNINRTASDKCWAWVNSSFNEIWFFYPSANATEVDSYVIYSYTENWWSIGQLSRTAGIDVSNVSESNPLAVDGDGTLFVHESGDLDDASPMASYLTTAPFDIEQGDQVAICNRFVPDIFYTRPGVQNTITFTGFPYPESTESYVKGPYVLTETTTKIDFRMRARQVQFTIRGVNGFYQLGASRLLFNSDGER